MSNKLKISFVIPGVFRSGGIKMVMEHASRLASAGHDVCLYAPRKRYNIYKGRFKPFYSATIFLKNILFPLNDKFEETDKLNFEVKTVDSINDRHMRDSDIVVATAWMTAEDVWKLGPSKGKKVYFIQGYEVWDAHPDVVGRTYSKDFTRIVVSGYLKELILKKFGKDSVVIPNGIDFVKFNNDGKTYTDKITLTFISSEINIKNLDGALNVAGRIHEEYPDVNIVSFGFEPVERMPEYVKFFRSPSESEIKEIYCSTDIFLYTSLYEGFGLPPAEAMACKCAVVTNNVGAVPDYSAHLSSAYHCDPERPDGLYEGVKFFIDNKTERIRISENAAADVRKSLNFDRSSGMMEELFLKLAAENNNG